MDNINKKICNLQYEMLHMQVGRTKVISGKVITRWTDDSFEVNTFGTGNTMCSEHAAEKILNFGY